MEISRTGKADDKRFDAESKRMGIGSVMFSFQASQNMKHLDQDTQNTLPPALATSPRSKKYIDILDWG